MDDDCIYFDHAATTPLDERVFEAMLPWMKEEFGNANSLHQKGRTAKVALEDARESIAAMIHAEPAEIIFTSGGTESNNAVIKGAFDVMGDRKEILTSEIEHHAVLHTVECTKRHGGVPVLLKPDSTGEISPKQVEEAITDRTGLVSLMHVNNELGTINPLPEIAAVCREHGVPFHSDCVQSAGKLPLNVDELGVDFLSLSGHKLYGPNGIGVMYVRKGTPWIPWMTGGSQERRRRGGTSNIPGAVGLQKAMELSVENMDDHQALFIRLRERLIEKMDQTFGDQYQINGPQTGGVPHIVNIGFTGLRDGNFDSEMLLLNLDIEDVCVSNGSACTSGAVEPSHVLTGIGLEKGVANASIRLSFGTSNTPEQIDTFVGKLDRVLNRMTAGQKV